MCQPPQSKPTVYLHNRLPSCPSPRLPLPRALPHPLPFQWRPSLVSCYPFQFVNCLSLRAHSLSSLAPRCCYASTKQPVWGAALCIKVRCAAASRHVQRVCSAKPSVVDVPAIALRLSLSLLPSTLPPQPPSMYMYGDTAIAECRSRYQRHRQGSSAFAVRSSLLLVNDLSVLLLSVALSLSRPRSLSCINSYRTPAAHDVSD